MQDAFGLEIPETLEEACDPTRAALLVYDMQVGVLSQVPQRDEVIESVQNYHLVSQLTPEWGPNVIETSLELLNGLR